jgi:hypothetical protein
LKEERWCLGQQKVDNNWGYSMLQYKVSFVALNEKGEMQLNKKGGVLYRFTQTFETSTFTCSKLFDLNGYDAKMKYGYVLAIHDVKSDQSCWYDKKRCEGFKEVSPHICWQMDIEAFGTASDSKADIDDEEYEDEK